MGPTHDPTRLQAAVSHRSSHVQGNCLFTCAGRSSPNITRGNRHTVNERRCQNSSARPKSCGFLFKIFPGPEEGNTSAQTNIGSKSSEQILKKVYVSNAHVSNPIAIRTPRRLVHYRGSHRRVLSHKNIPTPQQIPEIRISGGGIRISETPIWLITKPTDVCKMHGSGSGSPEGERDPYRYFCGRLGCGMPIGSTSERAYNSARRTPHCVGIQYQLQKECIEPYSNCLLSGLVTKLNHVQSASVTRKNRQVQPMSGTLPKGQSDSLPSMPQTAGADGLSVGGSPTGPLIHEGLATLGSISQARPITSRSPKSESDDGSVHGTNSMAEPELSDRGGAYGHSASQESCNNRCIPPWLGRDTRGLGNKRKVEPESAIVSHKLSGVTSSLADAESFSSPAKGASCPSSHGQHDCCSIREQTRGAKIPTATHACTQTDFVGQQSFSISESYTRPWSSESGSGPAVSGRPTLQRVEAQHQSVRSDLVDFRQGISGPVCVTRHSSMPSLLLSPGAERSTRSRRSSARMAESCSSLRISTHRVNSAHPGQGEGETFIANSNCSPMAGETLVSGDNRNVVQGTMAASVTQGPTVSGEGGDISPQPREASAMGLAVEWNNLNATGLPPNVIKTIQSARAASTRSLYGCKWSVFERWCVTTHEIPYQCSISTILSFLQDLIDRGRAFSTIKVFLAAISACHVGIGGKSVGQHPLVVRFMKGARRSLPVSKPLAPSWDLSMVLEVISAPPFEPLMDVDFKTMSLKTALLLALASTKRVSELQALSVHPSCLQFAPGDCRVSLRPNPAFMPKVIQPCIPLELTAFRPPPFDSPEQQRLHALCPVRALRIYVDRTAAFRQSDQLFVSWAKPYTGKPISTQRLSHWIVDAICLAYSSKGLSAPAGLRAHSTRGLATSWALFEGVSMDVVCRSAGWSSYQTFVRFYKLDVTATPVAHAVLGVGASRSGPSGSQPL